MREGGEEREAPANALPPGSRQVRGADCPGWRWPGGNNACSAPVNSLPPPTPPTWGMIPRSPHTAIKKSGVAHPTIRPQNSMRNHHLHLSILPIPAAPLPPLTSPLYSFLPVMLAPLPLHARPVFAPIPTTLLSSPPLRCPPAPYIRPAPLSSSPPQFGMPTLVALDNLT